MAAHATIKRSSAERTLEGGERDLMMEEKKQRKRERKSGRRKKVEQINTHVHATHGTLARKITVVILR